MSSAIDRAFGVQAKALSVYARRAEVLSANIANSDTPNYKAKDLDFRTIMSQAQRRGGPSPVQLRTTENGHMGGAAVAEEGLKYRIPMQSSLDGNTVNNEVEQASFAENNIKYQASFSFLNGTIKGLKTAIRGE